MNNRKVTEQDFRMPEFRDANPDDYEFRQDGKIVRKDRWERGLQQIASIVGFARKSFEIDEIVDIVHRLSEYELNWCRIEECSDKDDYPDKKQKVMLLLFDGSILKNVYFIGFTDYGVPRWSWWGTSKRTEGFTKEAVAWKEDFSKDGTPDNASE